MKMTSIKLPKIKVYGIDIIKNSLFFAGYILLTLLIIVFILAPIIKIFKKEKNNYYLAKSQFDKNLKEYNNIKKSLFYLKNNSQLLKKFYITFNIKDFKKFSSKYMQIKNIKSFPKTYYKNFSITPFLVKATINSPENFYQFIDNLKNYKNIIRVYFPINFEKNKEDINLTFKIEVYNLKE